MPALVGEINETATETTQPCIVRHGTRSVWCIARSEVAEDARFEQGSGKQSVPAGQRAAEAALPGCGAGGARTHDRRIMRSTAPAPCALAAQMARVIALIALAALGLTEAPVHEPVHDKHSERLMSTTERYHATREIRLLMIGCGCEEDAPQASQMEHSVAGFSGCCGRAVAGCGQRVQSITSFIGGWARASAAALRGTTAEVTSEGLKPAATRSRNGRDRGAGVGSAGVQGAAPRVHREQGQGLVLEVDGRAGAGAVGSGAVERAPQAFRRTAGVDRDRGTRRPCGVAGCRWPGRRARGEREPARVLVQVGDVRRAEGDREPCGVQADRVGSASPPTTSTSAPGSAASCGPTVRQPSGCCRSRWRPPPGRCQRGVSRA